MTTNKKEINFFDIVKIIKKNYLKILILSLLILIIPSILIYKNHNKDLYTLKFNYDLILTSSNNLRVANNTINELYHNQLFRGLMYKLDMFYTEFGKSDKINKNALSPRYDLFLLNEDKINYINKKYIFNALKKSQFIKDNEISVNINNLVEKDYLSDYSMSLSKKIKWDELKKVDILIANLSDNINKTLIDEIILTIEDAISQFQISKTDLIESLEKSNELISESYIFDLKYKIAELKNKLQIVKFIESKENTNKFNEYFKSYLDNNSPTKGSANEFINLAIPGSGVIQRQIDQLNEKINLSIKDLPLIFFNNQLIQLVESEFFKNQIINYNKFPYNSSNLFYLNDYEIDNDSLSFNLAITYFSFFIIFSLISAIIFYIILDIIRKYN